jgi:hypothetical protein
MRIFILVIFLLICGSASAQFGACIDSTLKQPGYNCPNGLINYTPICGCDGVTYNNSCIAEKTGGVTPGNFTDGPCGDFDYYFTPNTVSYFLEYNYYSKTAGILNLFIFDAMGHIKYEYREPVQLPGFVVRDRFVDVSSLESGIYLFMITKDGTQIVKKFFMGSPF